MNLLSLKYFIAVAENKNFTKTAEHLRVSQPTLSRHIMELEEELGIPLFSRDRNSRKLTDEGKLLLKGAKEIVARCDALPEVVRQTGNTYGGTLSIGYQEFLNTDIMYASIKSLSKQNPRIHVSLTRGNSPTLLSDLENGTHDIIFTLFLCIKTMPNVQYKRLRSNKLQIGVSSKHRLAGQKEVHISELVKERFVMLEHSVSPITLEYSISQCVKHGFSPTASCYVKDAETAMLMAAAGRGVVFLNSCVSASPPPNLVAVDLRLSEPDRELDLVAAYQANNTNPVLPVFIDQVVRFRSLDD